MVRIEVSRSSYQIIGCRCCRRLHLLIDSCLPRIWDGLGLIFPFEQAYKVNEHLTWLSVSQPTLRRLLNPKASACVGILDRYACEGPQMWSRLRRWSRQVHAILVLSICTVPFSSQHLYLLFLLITYMWNRSFKVSKDTSSSKWLSTGPWYSIFLHFNLLHTLGTLLYLLYLTYTSPYLSIFFSSAYTPFCSHIFCRSFIHTSFHLKVGICVWGNHHAVLVCRKCLYGCTKCSQKMRYQLSTVRLRTF